MIELGMHSDNWRQLSGNLQAAIDSAVKNGLSHLEFGVIHGQYFSTAYDRCRSSQPAAQAATDRHGLSLADRRGFSMMGPEDPPTAPYVQQAIRFAAEIAAPSPYARRGTEDCRLRGRRVFRITCDNYRQLLPWAETMG
jgi:hypothetical protein